MHKCQEAWNAGWSPPWPSSALGSERTGAHSCALWPAGLSSPGYFERTSSGSEREPRQERSSSRQSKQRSRRKDKETIIKKARLLGKQTAYMHVYSAAWGLYTHLAEPVLTMAPTKKQKISATSKKHEAETDEGEEAGHDDKRSRSNEHDESFECAHSTTSRWNGKRLVARKSQKAGRPAAGKVRGPIPFLIMHMQQIYDQYM